MRGSAIRVVPFLALLAAIGIGSPPAYAQGGGSTSSIIGTVTDASDAVIPGASVTVKSNATATT